LKADALTVVRPFADYQHTTAAKLKLIPTIAMTYNIKILLDPSRLLRVTEGP